MCLTLSKTFKSRSAALRYKPHIAQTDIPVYKGLGRKGAAPHLKNMTYERGYHYYQDGRKKFGKAVIQWFAKEYMLEINVGLHSAKSKAEAARHGIRVVKMYIPKGSKFYENHRHYVSDNLVWYGSRRRKKAGVRKV